jgi:RNA polymerase sigma-70 factor, ECF subfamily
MRFLTHSELRGRKNPVIGLKTEVKRSASFPHYTDSGNVALLSDCTTTLGSQPGNYPGLDSVKVPEPTGKRLRCFFTCCSPMDQTITLPPCIGVSDFPVPASRPISKTRHRLNGHSAANQPIIVAPDSGQVSPREVLNCVPLPGSRGKMLQFHSFDEEYCGRLRAGDFRTREHFHKYFSAVMKTTLRTRLKSREAIEDVQQETFVRVLEALRDEKIREPQKLGSFVLSICRNVLREHYRDNERGDRFVSIDKDDAPELPAASLDLVKIISDQQSKEKLQKVLEQLPERDRRVLHAIVFEERDKDEVCREFGINRDNLRLILHRAKERLKSLYYAGNDSLGLVPA